MGFLAPVSVLALALAALALYVWSLVWVYRDARDRGCSAGLITVLVALVSWPLGLLVWVFFRPEALDGEPMVNERGGRVV